MEKRIELEKRGRKANQITELNLDNCRSTSIVGLTDEFTALEILSLINVGLTTLKGFPKLPNLKKLELSDNRISNGLSNLASSPKLINLNLSGNKIKDLEEIKPLESFKCLESLDLFNNEATSVENYRTKIFSMIPSLKYLDGFDAHSVEAPSEPDDEDGSDEDVNGNESSGDDEAKNENVVICGNGLDIDLDEFEQYEKRIAEKRKSRQVGDGDPQPQSSSNSTTNNTTTSVNDTCNGYDDLDEYLDKLVIEKKRNDASAIAVTTANTPHDNIMAATICNNKPPPASLPVLLYTFMSLLVFINCVHKFSGEDDDLDSVDDEEEDESAGDPNEVSLGELYNDELEEDNSDWNEAEESVADEESDMSDDSEGNEKSVNQADDSGAPPAAADDESPRGKKRKHDG